MAKLPPRSMQDMLNDFYGSTIGTAGAGLGPQQGSTFGGAGGAGPQLDPYAGMFGTLDPAVAKQLMSAFTMGLTFEEKEEYERLLNEHNANVKKAKLDTFKKVAPEMRQFVINALTWREECIAISQSTADKSERLQVLEQKSNRMFNAGFGTAGMSSWYPHTAEQAGLAHLVSIPDGLTIDDLKLAHIEATLEEEMLNGKEEKV